LTYLIKNLRKKLKLNLIIFENKKKKNLIMVIIIIKIIKDELESLL